MFAPNSPNAAAAALIDEATIPVFARWFGSWRISLQRRALSASQLARSYDRAAPGWSRKLDRLGVPAAYETLLSGVLREEPLGLEGGVPRVLDCGVGTGALSCALARVLPARFTLDAVDLSPRMLERAAVSLRDSGIEASLRQADVCDLSYETGTFDLVMAAHVLEHLPDPAAALSEMVRVLRPGGLLLACLTRRSALGAYVQLKWRTHRATPGQAENWLRECGLEETRCCAFDQHSLSRRFSLACLGRKPLGAHHNGLHDTAPIN